MSEGRSKLKTTRRDAIKLAGAAALGAAGTAALGAPRVLAAGSGNTIAMYFTPERVIDTRGSAKIGHGGEAVVGPYTIPGGGFDWADYYGIIGNLTATSWVGPGYLSVRPGETVWDPTTGVSNVNYAGSFGGSLLSVRKTNADALASASSPMSIERCRCCLPRQYAHSAKCSS